MIIFCYFEKENLDKLIQALSLLEYCNVDSIGEMEKRTKSDIWIKDKVLIQRFISEHKEGFFLHSCGGLFNISIYENTFSTVCFYPVGKLDEINVLNVLKAYALAHAEFGYAADIEEFEHRNRIKVEFSGSAAESWVGRNLSKYLSGLYYLTLISKGQLNDKSIDTEILVSHATKYIELADGVVLFKFFESAEKWKFERDKLDRLCYESHNIFSKAEVENEAQSAANVMDFIMKARSWN